MDTSMIDRWTEFTQMEDRVRFDLYMEGLLNRQKLDAIRNDIAREGQGAVSSIQAVLEADEINQALLLNHDAQEV